MGIRRVCVACIWIHNVFYSDFCRIIPSGQFIKRIKTTNLIYQHSCPSTDKAVTSCIIPTKAKGRTYALNAMRISVTVDNDVEIIICQQAPTFRTYTLMIGLYRIGTTLIIAFERQLHHFSPLIEASITITIGCIIIVAVTFYFRIIFLIFKSPNHLTNIQIFSHHLDRGGFASRILAVDLDIIILTFIARVRKLSILII